MSLFDDITRTAKALKNQTQKAVHATLESEETKENVAKLKADFSEVKRQLKESGAEITSHLKSDASKDEKHSGADSQSSEQNEAIPTKPIETTSQEPEPEPTRPVASKRQGTHNTKIILVLAVALACALLGIVTLTFISRSHDTKENQVGATPTEQQGFEIQINIECEPNMLFSTYNVRASVDGKKLGIVEHGDIATFNTTLSEGSHTITFNEEGDSDVDGKATFSVEQDAAFAFSISCSKSSISVDDLSPEDWNERYAQRLEKIVGPSGRTAQETIGQLENAGYEEQGYDLLCQEAGKKLTDFDQSTYDVTEGTVDADDKTITLTLKSNLPIEVNFSEEDGRRAVVVAITNCYATDVFNEAGNYDSSRFHSYADMSGYYMTVEEKGSWEAVDTKTRNVSGLVLKTAGTDFYAQVDARIAFDGTNFTVSQATVQYASSIGAITSHDENKLGVERLEPGDSRPYLTVPASLVADGRDTQAENQARDAENAAKEEQESYDSWLSSQFSWWDGRNDALVDAVKEQLNDEESFKHIDTGYIACRSEEDLNSVNSAFAPNGNPVANLNDVYVTMQFSAKNAFNGTIKSRAHGIIHYPSGEVTLLLIE